MQYPFYRNLLNEQQIRDGFKLIKNANVEYITNTDALTAKYANNPRYQAAISITNETGGKIMGLIKLNNATSDYDFVTDWFVENVRVLCTKLKYKHSAAEIFQQNVTQFKKFMAEARNAPSPIIAAKHRFQKTLARDCDLFPAPIVYEFYRLWRPRNILDMCAGWGDRLLAALAYDPCFYCGVDPNEGLHTGYNEMIQFFAKDTKKYLMLPRKFEEAELPDIKYDLMFTSPPYFISEQYIKPDEYGGLEQWKNVFLFPSLKKTWDRINDFGRVAIVISDTVINDVPYKYTADMIKYMLTLGATFEGTILYQHVAWNRDIVQPVYVFRKLAQFDLKIHRDIYNPPPIIRDVTFSFRGRIRTVKVVREDYLVGGSKQRAAAAILVRLAAKGYKTIIYRGPINGIASAAIGYLCSIIGLTAVSIINAQRDHKSHYNHYMMHLAALHGTKIIEVNKEAADVEVKKIVASYENTFVIPLGFDFDEFREEVYNALSVYKDHFTKDTVTLWSATTTGNMLRPLYKLFPSFKFACVLVGFKDESYIDHARSKIYHAPETYYQHAIRRPPYPAAADYDAKIWQFILTSAENGDIIWNIN